MDSDDKEGGTIKPNVDIADVVFFGKEVRVTFARPLL